MFGLPQIQEAIFEIARATGEAILNYIKSKLLESDFFTTEKRIYNEQSAADYLGISKTFLQSERRTNQLNFIWYNAPKDEILDAKVLSEHRRNGLYGYTREALLEYALDHEQLVKPRVFERASDLLRVKNNKRF